TFTRPKLLTGPSGITFPQWSAHALDGAGNEIAVVGENLISSFSDVPAQTFHLAGTGIRQLRIDSNNFHFAAFSALLLDDLTLTVVGSNVFWIDPNGDPDATAIFRASTAGGAITKIYSGFASGQPIVDGVGITTDGVRLYTSDDVQGRVHTLNIDGSGITQLG